MTDYIHPPCKYKYHGACNGYAITKHTKKEVIKVKCHCTCHTESEENDN